MEEVSLPGVQDEALAGEDELKGEVMKITTPVNLIETFEDEPSNAYVRHVVKSALRHAMDFADLMEMDAEKYWEALGFKLANW